MSITIQAWLSIFNDDPVGHVLPCQSEAQQIFATLDINGDTEITHQEWNSAFQHLDTDGNGAVSRQEWQRRFGSARVYDTITFSMQLTRSDWGTLYARIDANGDGKINLSEWLEKLTSSTVQQEATKVFNILDQDNNGMITQREWLAAFHLIDVNTDGHLARAEWLARFGSEEIFNMISSMSSLYMTMDQWLGAFDRFVAVSSVPYRQSQVVVPLQRTPSIRSAPVPQASALPGSGYRVQPQPMHRPLQRVESPRVSAAPTSSGDLQKEASQVFRNLDLDGDGMVTMAEWMTAFDFLDTDRNGSISRKEWYVRHGSMEIYNSIPKHFWANLSRQEWRDAFGLVDTNNDGALSLHEWLASLRAMLNNDTVQWTAPMGINDWAQGYEERQTWVSRMAMQHDASVTGSSAPTSIDLTGDFESVRTQSVWKFLQGGPQGVALYLDAVRCNGLKYMLTGLELTGYPDTGAVVSGTITGVQGEYMIKWTDGDIWSQRAATTSFSWLKR